MLKEVEERARLTAHNGEEEMSKMGICLGVEEEKAELRNGRIELEKNVARLKADLIKEGKRFYLVCCMYEEALALASSVLERKTDNIEDVQLADMMESAGIVLVQSLKELGRTSEILNELKVLYGSVTAVPVQVLLTGACFQISEGFCSGLRESLDEYLAKWRYVDGQSYIFVNLEPNQAFLKGTDGHCVMEVEKYLDIVELYAVTLLGKVLNDIEVAMAWVEKAELPEENRKELLRRLHSIKSTNSSKSLEADESEAHAASGIVSTTSRVEEATTSSKDNMKQTIMKLNERMKPCFWWFRTVSIKFGNHRLIISNGKIVLWSSLIFCIYYLLRKKRTTLKQIASKQALSVKKAVVDMWQLAFSVQVDPLAAIRPVLPATHSSR
ncbi:hypothetical protein GIB67_043212 [Kingdonia uniflora]|uniref:3-phosphoinositide-dependent protein kinase-1 n=1 Tax=Kingdonia uniflora TaxID=39325 RepID=A0A7J7NJC7_9MAGN|nr:hypothetical protein GIB67_043212 [Kingdonia uniflora]